MVEAEGPLNGGKALETLDHRRAEFAANVWNHADDPFQMSFDDRPPLSAAEVEALRKIIDTVLDDTPEHSAQIIGPALKRDPILMGHCLQLVGLTRNKILQDLKAATRTGAVKVQVPSSYKALPASAAWKYAGPYLTKKLQTVFLPFAGDRAVLDAAIEALNQATWPGYIRQERAKRSGHEAEFRIAALHLACGIPFEPEEKAQNPLCRDLIIKNVSFDLVIPGAANPAVCVKSTVHTSNIGQYGESKDHLEVDEAKRMLDDVYGQQKNRPVLLAFIDGVGFESNRAGLHGVLQKADEFCQFNTIWKAIMISSTRMAIPMTFIIPKKSRAAHSAFLARHQGQSSVVDHEGHALTGDEIEAGEALILL